MTGKEIRKLMIDYEANQSKVAAKLNITQSAFSKWLKNDSVIEQKKDQIIKAIMSANQK